MPTRAVPESVARNLGTLLGRFSPAVGLAAVIGPGIVNGVGYVGCSNECNKQYKCCSGGD